MKITEYFINHPVTSTILNSMIILVGILCFYSLKVKEYPDVIIPNLTVQAVYPNASADLIESSVTNILEDNLAGVEGLKSISSISSDAVSIITLHFNAGTPINQAMTSTRDAVAKARGNLPTQVREPVVSRGNNAADSGIPFIAICLESNSMGFGELTHYALVSLKNAFRSIQGVASVSVWGQPYIYKIILDHQKMYNFGINADEIYNAIERSNISLPVGKFQKELSATLNLELKSPEDFGNIIIKNSPNPVLLKSLADINLTTDDQEFRVKINGKPGLCLGISKTIDDNPLEVSDLVHKQLNDLKSTMPDSIKTQILIDQAEFIRASLLNIEYSIAEAMLLVLLIVFLFLRNVRATLIPIITIPISLIGSLLFLKLFGFSINIMTLLAMVLAVGLVVDDAIIVLENITRHLENGESPKNAAIKGAKEIGFAIVAMTLTLTSVYAPIAFVTGMVGQLFIEFAAALAGSVLISGVVAITLSPLMCAKILTPNPHRILPQIDVFLIRLSEGYSKYLRIVMHYKKYTLIFAGLALVTMIYSFNVLPRETAPSEDRALVHVFIPSPAGKNIDHAEKNVKAVENIIKNIPEAMGRMTFIGDFGGYVVLPLKPIEDRKYTADEVVSRLRPKMMSFPSFDAWINSWSTSLPGLDNTASSELILKISTIGSYKDLFEEVTNTTKIGEEQKLFSSITHDLNLDNLGMDINIDKNILANLNLTEEQTARMIEIFFSGNRSLEFKKDGILYPILIEGDIKPWNLEELYLTTPTGARTSISSFATLTTKQAPNILKHYNQMRSVNLTANLTPGENIEKSMRKLYKLADETLPKSYKKTWVGIAKTYNESASSTLILFFLSMLFIYAILAVQFESFVDPLIILFTVPLACSGALLTLYLTGGTLNIYSQVGLITLIGLITKHGILIVEFANKLQEEGKSLLEATLESAHLRLRPILMTTGAMICGTVPLILSNSAGSEARHAIGVTLVSGLSFGTIFTLFILPSLYYMVKNLSNKTNHNIKSN